MPIDKTSSMWYNKSRKGEGTTPKNQKGIITMEIRFTVDAEIIENTLLSTNYLTGDDERSEQDCIDNLAKAVLGGDVRTIRSAVRDFVNNENRNRKINKHEEIINYLYRLIYENTKEGDIVNVGSLAHQFEINPDRYGWMMTKMSSPYCSEIRFRSPVGATTTALNRLVENGIFVVKFVQIESFSTPSRCYVRIK